MYSTESVQRFYIRDTRATLFDEGLVPFSLLGRGCEVIFWDLSHFSPELPTGTPVRIKKGAVKAYNCNHGDVDKLAA
jgi:hypothetical protein